MMHLAMVIVGLCSVSLGQSPQFSMHGPVLDKPILKGPTSATIGAIESFNCRVPALPENDTVELQYDLYMERNMDKGISTYSALSGQEAKFLLSISPHHEGRLICKASGHNNSAIQHMYSNSHHLTVIDPVAGAHILPNPSSGKLWERQTLTLLCNLTRGNHVSYNWLMGGRVISQNQSSNRMTIPNVSVQHSGSYVCEATNGLDAVENYTSTSIAMLIKVKEFVSNPEISFDIVKDRSGEFAAHVACQSIRGAPLITFTLYNNSEPISRKTTEELNVTFVVPIILNQHMGMVHCKASNEGSEAQSNILSLNVESVGGVVTVRYEKDLGEDFAVVGLRLFCYVEKGTLPFYQWSLNGKILEESGHLHAFAWPDHSILLLSISAETSGLLYCEARDRFDDVYRVRSKELLIDQEELNRVPTEVVVTVFTCFMVLATAVTACCLYGGVIRRRQMGGKFTLNNEFIEMDSEDDKSEELDGKGYMDDMDVVNAAHLDDLYLDDVESADEVNLTEEALEPAQTELGSISESL